MAIEHAHRILDWQENLTEDEMPPHWMWIFEDELKIWFEEVEAKRKDKYGGGDDSGDSSVPMMTNDLAKDRRG